MIALPRNFVAALALDKRRYRLSRLLLEIDTNSRVAAPSTVHKIRKGLAPNTLTATLAETFEQHPDVVNSGVEFSPVNWQWELDQVLLNGCTYLKKTVLEADEHDYRVVSSITRTVKELAELQMTIRILERRFEG